MIKDLWRPHLRVNVGAPLGQPETVRVFFHPEEIGACQNIAGIAATVDGVPLTRLHGRVREKGYDYDRDCNVFEFEAPLSAVAGRAVEGISRVEVTDGESTAVMEVANLFADRALVPTTPGPYARGETITLRWQPGGDTIDPKFRFALLLRANGDEKVVGGEAVGVTPESVRVTLPLDLPASWVGPVDAEFVGTGGVQPTVKRCVWAVDCQANRVYTLPKLTLTLR